MLTCVIVVGVPSDFRQIESDDWVPTININVHDKVIASPNSGTNPHGVIVHSRLKKRKLFHENQETADVGDPVNIMEV